MRGAGLADGWGAACIEDLGAAGAGAADGSEDTRGGALAGSRDGAGFPMEGSEAERLPNINYP